MKQCLLLVHVLRPINTLRHVIRGGADKSLARLTSRCSRTESMSLERVVCLSGELQVFIATGAERKHVRLLARFQYGDASYHQVPFPSDSF